MQQFRHEDDLYLYYPQTFTFDPEQVPELDDKDYVDEFLTNNIDPETNQLFVKSKIYFDESAEKPIRYYNKKTNSPKKRYDIRSDEPHNAEHSSKPDDVRMRDRQHYKKKDKKKDVEMPLWALSPQ